MNIKPKQIASSKTKKVTLKKRALVAVAACTTLGVVGLAQVAPALADKAIEATIIDKDLESALQNHFQKRFFNLIEATDKQKSAISSLVSDQLSYSRPLRQEMKDRALAMSDLIVDESVTDEQLADKIAEIRAVKEKLADRRIQTVLKIRSLLTKEQRQVVAAKMRSRLTGNPRLGLLLNR